MSDTARMLSETTARLLAAHPASPRGDIAALRGDTAALLASLRDAGLTLALVPEAEGGVGCSLGEAAEIARAWGAGVAPLPLAELLLAPRLAVLAGDAALGANATVAQLRTGDEGNFVLEAPLFPGCDAVLVPIDSHDGSGLAVLPPDGVSFTDLSGAPWVRAEVSRQDLAASARPLPAGSREALAAEAALLTATLASGAMDHVVAAMIDYANARSQFGKPIGKFQAVQHMLADASAEATVTKAGLQAALADADGGVLRPIDWLAAKAQAGRAATLVASVAHQLFGAIGFTQEHELHHYTKRLWWWRDDWGRQADCERRLGELAAAGELWPAIVGE